jgi:peroxiredoxin
VCPIKNGSRLPRLTLTGIEGKKFDLNDAVAKKPTVLVFYRGGWCPYCNSQLSELRKAEPELLKMGYQIMAISPDLPTEQRKTLIKQELSYTLLSDSKMTAAQTLGIAFRVDDATYAQYKKNGVDLEKSSGERHHLLPVPTVFVVGTDGTIHFSYLNPDYRVRLNPDVLLAAAKAALPTSAKPAAPVAAGARASIRGLVETAPVG